jgi:hypothetical protein
MQTAIYGSRASNNDYSTTKGKAGECVATMRTYKFLKLGIKPMLSNSI